MAAWVHHVLGEFWTHTAPHAPPASKPISEPATMQLTFLPTETGWHGLVRTADTQHDFAITGDPVTLAREVFALRKAIQAHGHDWRPLATGLYDRLIRPIEPLVGSMDHVRIAGADRALAYLPFAALHDGERFLIERAALSMQTGIPAPDRPVPPRKAWRLRLLGNGGKGPHRLAHVEGELLSIAAASKQARRLKPFNKAVLAAALADGAEAIHVSGHFELEAARPDRSYLSLGSGGEKLSLDELRTERFNFSRVELLTLSACDTAVAQRGPFGLESLAGLARAKGARNVLGTLWPVSDASAAYLMPKFYQAALADGTEVSMAEALRSAQLTLLRMRKASDKKAGRVGAPATADGPLWSHPYHWAGYGLYD